MVSVDVDAEQHFFCFETLANELRLDIIRLLDEREAMNVSQLAAETGAERSRVSHSLQVLKQCKFVVASKEGREMRYRLNTKTPLFKNIRGNIFSMIEEHVRESCPKCAKYRAHHGGRR